MMLHKKRRVRSPALWLGKGDAPRKAEPHYRGCSAISPPGGEDENEAWEALFRDDPEECVPWNVSDEYVDDDEEEF